MRYLPGAIVKLGCAVLLAGGLAGCREGESNRPLELEPGVYLGKKDEKLSEQQRDELRERARLQAY